MHTHNMCYVIVEDRVSKWHRVTAVRPSYRQLTVQTYFKFTTLNMRIGTLNKIIDLKTILD